MTTTITTTGWLIAGTQRVLLSTLERYEQRDGKVLLYAAKWSVAVDCAPADEPAVTVLEDSTQSARVVTDAELNAAWEAKTAKATDDAAALVAALDAYFTPPAP